MAIVDHFKTKIHTKYTKYKNYLFDIKEQSFYLPKLKRVKTNDSSHFAYRHKFRKLILLQYARMQKDIHR